MSFEQKLWKDRNVQHPGRRILTNINDDTDIQEVIVERAEGTVTEPGDLYCATTMNGLEQRLADAFDEINSVLQEEVNHVYPIGAIYQSFDRTSPEVLFPGTTWEPLYDKQLKVGRVPLVVPLNEQSGQNRGNTSYTITKQYSSKSVQVTGSISPTALSNNQIPPHTHTYMAWTYDGNTSAKPPMTGGSYAWRAYTAYTETTGKGYAHNHDFTKSGTFTENPVSIDIRQQYITMYAWRRTA